MSISRCGRRSCSTFSPTPSSLPLEARSWCRCAGATTTSSWLCATLVRASPPQNFRTSLTAFIARPALAAARLKAPASAWPWSRNSCVSMAAQLRLPASWMKGPCSLCRFQPATSTCRPTASARGGHRPLLPWGPCPLSRRHCAGFQITRQMAVQMPPPAARRQSAAPWTSALPAPLPVWNLALAIPVSWWPTIMPTCGSISAICWAPAGR